MNNQLNIFDFLYPNYKITKPIRLIELFAGYGSQALALKYLGVNFEHWKISEWAIKSIQAYKDMHFSDKYYWKNIEDCGISKEVIADALYNIGISSNYNNPMSKKEIQRLSYEKLVRIYENILITNNLVNIQNIKGKRGMVQHQMIQTLKTCQDVGVLMEDFRIRNLTPLESGRLMGVKDEDVKKMTVNDSAKIHCFGDSIVVNVLMAIFGELFNIDWKNKLTE